MWFPFYMGCGLTRMVWKSRIVENYHKTGHLMGQSSGSMLNHSANPLANRSSLYCIFCIPKEIFRNLVWAVAVLGCFKCLFLAFWVDYLTLALTKFVSVWLSFWLLCTAMYKPKTQEFFILPFRPQISRDLSWFRGKNIWPNYPDEGDQNVHYNSVL